MAGSLNKVTIIGNLGADPEVKSMQNGKEVCNLNVATTDSWRDKNSGERQSKTEWHRVVIFSPGLVNVAKQYLTKGSKVYLEGSLQTRKWQDQSGQDKYSTEVVLQAFGSTLIMLDNRSDNNNNTGGGSYQQSGGNQSQASNSSSQNQSFAAEELEDEVPF